MVAGIIVLFLVRPAVAMRASVSRSVDRALAGGGSALLAAGLLALAMIHVIGQRSCPQRMGVDRGIQVAAQMLDAWRKGEAAPGDVWVSAAVADAWRARVGKLTPIDYKVVDSGCSERLAPGAHQPAWHEFRGTVQQGDDQFSKVVTVHTHGTRGGWHITEVEGPES